MRRSSKPVTTSQVVYDDTANTLTISATGGGGGGISLEDARDAIAAMLTEGDNITITYVDDGDNAGTITITASGGVVLSDDDPVSVSTGRELVKATATDASRRDHHHQVTAASTTQRGAIELATGNEARSGTDNVRAMTPLRVEQVLVDKASDVDPLDVGSTSIGTSTNFARGDHEHHVRAASITQAGVMEVASAQEVEAGVENDKAVTPESLETTYLDRLSDSTPEDVGTGAVGNSARAARGDHAHGGGVRRWGTTLG